MFAAMGGARTLGARLHGTRGAIGRGMSVVCAGHAQPLRSYVSRASSAVVVRQRSGSGSSRHSSMFALIRALWSELVATGANFREEVDVLLSRDTPTSSSSRTFAPVAPNLVEIRALIAYVRANFRNFGARFVRNFSTELALQAWILMNLDVAGAAFGEVPGPLSTQNWLPSETWRRRHRVSSKSER